MVYIFKKIKSLLYKLYVFVYIKVNNLKVINYLHIGKTGGTAIREAFGDKSWSGFFVKRHKHSVILRDIKDGEKIIFAVRDPVSRFVSAFNSRLREGLPKYFNPWTEDEKKVFSLFKTPQELAISISSDNDDIRNKAIMAMKSCSLVKTFYWDWFENEEYLNSRKDDILFVFRQEKLSEDFDFFVRKFLPGSKVGLPEDDVLRHKTPDGYNTSLSEEAVNNLKKWYKRDYEFLEFIQKLGLLKND